VTRGLSAVAVFALVAATAGAQWSGRHGVSWYGAAVFAVLTVKLLASLRHRPSVVAPAEQAELDRERVTVVVPVFNEDRLMLLRCLDSIARQTRRPYAVVVVDDGSTHGACQAEAEGWRRWFARLGVQFDVIAFETNRGKREALAAGFRRFAATLYLCVDSDTLLAPTAIAEAVKPFADPRVTGVTGLVLASNHRRNVLTRLIDLRYANAFLYERAAYSKLGSVLCACGSLSVYRALVVDKYLPDFLGQTFLGRPAVFGDDRRLTNYALSEGRVVLQESAVAWTAVPERLSHYIRQQVRWNKSFFRESVWVTSHLSPRRPAFWLTLVELTSWLVFTWALLTAVIVQPVKTGQVMFGMYVVYLVLLGYARSVRYFEVTHADTGPAERFGVFLLAPLYGVMHLLMLLPLRLYSLATLRVGRWGTRQAVEVTMTGVPDATPA
jgi:hyaluronan synthase